MSDSDSGVAKMADVSVELAEKLSRIKVISFDLDDTLWPLEPTITQAENQLYDWMKLQTPKVVEQNSAGDLFKQRRDFAEQNPGLRGDVTALRKASLASLFELYGYSSDWVEDAFDVFYKARSAVVPYEGAVQLLIMLRKHYKIAALTNGNADLQIAGMAEYFDDIQRASLDNPAKPATSMFDRTATILQCSTAELLHIGDNIETDVGGGKNAGAVTVWFNQDGETGARGSSFADIEINSLAELSGYLPRPSASGS